MSIASKRSPCQLLARLVEQGEQDIRTRKKEIERLSERLSQRHNRPNPDPELIEEIEDRIRTLKSALETDQVDLVTTREEFSASCGP